MVRVIRVIRLGDVVFLTRTDLVRQTLSTTRRGHRFRRFRGSARNFRQKPLYLLVTRHNRFWCVRAVTNTFHGGLGGARRVFRNLCRHKPAVVKPSLRKPGGWHGRGQHGGLAVVKSACRRFVVRADSCLTRSWFRRGALVRAGKTGVANQIRGRRRGLPK